MWSEVHEPVKKAFRKDPLVNSRELSTEELSNLVYAMVNNTKAYLPKGWNLGLYRKDE